MMGRQGDMFIFIITLRIHRSGHETAYMVDLQQVPPSSMRFRSPQKIWSYNTAYQLLQVVTFWFPQLEVTFSALKRSQKWAQTWSFWRTWYVHVYVYMLLFLWLNFCTLPLLESPFNTCFFCVFSLWLRGFFDIHVNKHLYLCHHCTFSSFQHESLFIWDTIQPPSYSAILRQQHDRYHKVCVAE